MLVMVILVVLVQMRSFLSSTTYFYPKQWTATAFFFFLGDSSGTCESSAHFCRYMFPVPLAFKNDDLQQCPSSVFLLSLTTTTTTMTAAALIRTERICAKRNKQKVQFLCGKAKEKERKLDYNSRCSACMSAKKKEVKKTTCRWYIGHGNENKK